MCSNKMNVITSNDNYYIQGEGVLISYKQALPAIRDQC